MLNGVSQRRGADNEYSKGQRWWTAEGNIEWERPKMAKREGNHENSVSGLFQKEDHEWIKWIRDGKHIRIDQKDKVQSIISSLRTNPAESTRIGLNLESVAKIVTEFENPTIPEEKSEENSSNTQ